MRIELNSGGLSTGVILSDYYLDIGSFIKSSKRMVSTFQAVTNLTYNMNGGAGNLQGAVNQIEKRITAEEIKTSAIENVEKKSSDFIELVKRTDIEASVAVNRSKNEFYRVNPWSKPPPPPEEKKWYQKAGEWICEKGQQLVDGVRNIRDSAINWSKSVADTISKAWNSAVEWCKNNKDFLKQIAIEVLVGAAVIGLAVLTGGTSLAITVAVAAGAGAALGGVSGAIGYYAENGTLKGASKSIIGGAAKGFMTGAISGYVGGQVGIAGDALKLGRGATTLVGAVSSGATSAGGEAIHAVSDGNGITGDEKKNIITSGITGFVLGGFGAYKGYGKETVFDKLQHNKQYTQQTTESIKQHAIDSMRQGKPNSIYNAQEAIRDLSAFNKFLMKDMVKREMFDKMREELSNKIGEDVVNVLISPTVVT